MSMKTFPVIDLIATGSNIRRLRMARGLTVRDLQSYFGFEEPRAIYKWQKGESLPTVDNLYALGILFEVPMDQILVPVKAQLHIVGEQQAEPCCSSFFRSAVLDTTGVRCNFNHFFRLRCRRRKTRSARRSEQKTAEAVTANTRNQRVSVCYTGC